MERSNKLVLPVPGGRGSVIQAVVAALEGGGADQVVVIAPPLARPGAVVLANHARVAGAEVIHLPADTADMRATIEFGLNALDEHAFAPEGILLSPGDLPGLSADAVRQVVSAARMEPSRIIVPTVQGRRGHPIALPWTLAITLRDLPPDVGANALLDRHSGQVQSVAIDDPAILADLDRPDDYRALLQRKPGE
jgi:molybdenum cofactor cytidylyltransferase